MATSVALHLADLRRIDIDVNDARVWREATDIAGHPVIKARADTDNQIRLVQRQFAEAVPCMPGGRGKADPSREAPLPISVAVTGIRAAAPGVNSVAGIGADDAAANIEHRAVSLPASLPPRGAPFSCSLSPSGDSRANCTLICLPITSSMLRRCLSESQSVPGPAGRCGRIIRFSCTMRGMSAASFTR